MTFVKSTVNFPLKLIAFFIATTMAVILHQSCSSEKIQTQDLDGKWLVIEAQRNGKMTTTLEEGFFQFQEDSIFSTNIFSVEMDFTYQLTEDGFQQRGEIDLDYIIEALRPDTLIVTSEIRNNSFRFVTIRDTTISQ